MGSIEDVVEGRDVVVDLVSRCKRLADWGRTGYQAGSRSRTVEGIGSWLGGIGGCVRAGG